MNKTKIILLSSIAVTVVAMVVTFFIMRTSGDAYVNAIPRDATAIVRLDAKAFLSEAKLGLKDLLRLFRRTKAEQENDEVKSLGIDMKRPIYAFTSSSGNLGFLASIDDADDLTNFLKEEHDAGRASEMTRQRGYSWIVVNQQWLLAFDGKRALMMGPALGSAQDLLRTEMVALLEQDKDESACSQKLFARLEDGDEPLVAVVAPEVFPAEARRFLRTFKVRSIEDAMMRLSCECENNELKLEADVLAESPEVKDELKRLGQLMRPLRGQLIDYAHADHVAWLAVNVEGSTLLDALRSNPTIRAALVALNLIVDADRIIRAVDGDVAIELTGSPSLYSRNFSDFQIQNMYVTAKVAHTDFLDGATSWGNSFIGVQTLTPTDFALNLGTSTSYFGVKDKIFYFGSRQGLSDEGNRYLQDERSDIRQARFFATFDLPALTSSDMRIPLDLSRFERVNIVMEDAGEFKLKLIAPEGCNIAREILMGNIL